MTRLAVRAGEPPSAVNMLLRFNRLQRLNKQELMDEVWIDWEIWFSELEESHTSLAALVFFRSPQPGQSLRHSGGHCPRAALTASTLDLPTNPRVNLCIRAGFVTPLRRIADFFAVEYNSDAHFPEDLISISRMEFDEVYDALS